MSTTKADPNDAGCWIDGHWGQYAVARMIEIAADLGYQDSAVDIAARHLASMGPSDSPDITDEQYEDMLWAADEVEYWLNENVAPEGFSFGWYEGEFFLWPDESWEEDSY